MNGARRQGLIGAICLIAIVAAAMPASAQWSLPRFGGGAPLDQASIDAGLVIAVVWTTWSPRGRNIVERLNRLEAEWGGRSRVVSIVFQDRDSISDGC